MSCFDYLSFLNEDSDKERENCKEENRERENNNRRRHETFLNICREKASNSDSKRAFNCVLKAGFPIRDVRRALDGFLGAAASAALPLRGAMTTKRIE
jgi:hypothetical protein